MKVKTGRGAADVRFMRTEIVSKLWNIEQIILHHCPWMDECTITSGNDGRHMAKSKHYKNTAVDLRTWKWVVGSGDVKGHKRYIDSEPKKLSFIIRDMQQFLGDDYQVVWHKEDHAHIEWDP